MGEAALGGLRTPACLIGLIALAGCATPPEVKRDYLYEAAWRGSALTVVGRQMVIDAAAGAAPQTVTLIDVNARAEVAGDADRRARILDRRVETVRAELRRNGIAPVDIGRGSRRRARTACRPILPPSCRPNAWSSSPITDADRCDPPRPASAGRGASSIASAAAIA